MKSRRCFNVPFLQPRTSFFIELLAALFLLFDAIINRLAHRFMSRSSKGQSSGTYRYVGSPVNSLSHRVSIPSLFRTSFHVASPFAIESFVGYRKIRQYSPRTESLFCWNNKRAPCVAVRKCNDTVSRKINGTVKKTVSEQWYHSVQLSYTLIIRVVQNYWNVSIQLCKLVPSNVRVLSSCAI